MAVEINEYIPNVNEKPRITVKSTKFKQEFHVVPSPGGFVLYQVAVTKGSLPRELAGQYTSMRSCLEAVKTYEARHPGTKAVERDAKVERRNASKVQ